jgi:uncharacterized protein YicC (UPF0701 family)
VNDALLRVLAAAVVVIAVVQVAMFVWATRLARRVGESVERLERELRPVLTGLQTIASEGARAATMAASQVEQIERIVGHLRQQIDRTVQTVRQTVVTPARDAMALVQAVKEVLFGGGARSAGERRRRTSAEDDDALFIG